MAMCACITETRPLCRAIMWPASGCVCGPRPITGSTPMRFQVLAPMDGQPFLYVNKGSGSWADRYAHTRCDSVAGGKCGQDTRARAAVGGRFSGPLVHHGVRPGRLQSGVVRANGEEADCHSDLSQVSRRRLAKG